jgi:hypothetical protein
MLVSEEFAREPETKNWNAPVRLSLIWAHASRLYDIISPLADSQEERRRLLNYLNSTRPFWGRELFDYEPEVWDDSLHPRLLERQSFLGLAAGSLFAGLPFELLEKIDLLTHLRETCFIKMDEKTVPHYVLWKDYRNRTNAADSFLGDRGFSLFNLLFTSEAEDVMIFPQESLQESLKSLLQRITENPADSMSWVELIFVTDSLPLNSELQDEFKLIVEKLDFQNVWETDIELAFAILSFVVNQKAFLSEELKSKIENWLRWTVAKLAEKYSTKLYPNSGERAERENVAVSIAEIAARLTVEPFDPLISSQKWNDLIYELGQLWSNLPVLLEPALLRLWLDLPVEQLQDIGKNLLLAKVLR